MRTHRLDRADGRVFAFEIENADIRPGTLADLLATVGQVSNIQLPDTCSASNDTRLEFKFRGEDYVVWDPYGDRNRYWVIRKRRGQALDISALEKVFMEYPAPLIA